MIIEDKNFSNIVSRRSNGRIGKKHSEQTKIKISQALKGREFSEEHRNK
jgi:hypothetical protein